VSDSANALTASMTLDKLKELVKSGELHYVQLGGRTGGGSNSLSSEVTACVEKHGMSVPANACGQSTTSPSDCPPGRSIACVHSCVGAGLLADLLGAAALQPVLQGEHPRVQYAQYRR
jgi:hypothetical protein